MTLSKHQIRLLAAFAVANLVLAVGGWFVLVSPQRTNAATAAAGTLLAQNELALLTGQSTSGSTKPIAIHTSCLYKLDTALPAQADLPDLLFELDRLAKASNVTVLGISPQVAQALASGYTVVPINLSVEGTYFAVTGFLRNLRMLVSENGSGCPTANGPLLAVTSVVFSSSGTAKSPATIGLQAFYYGVTAGATPPVDTTSTDTTTTTGG
jgi:hypothetical protein